MSVVTNTVETRRERRERQNFRSLLSSRDWVYLLSLLVPFVAYDLALKASLVFLQPENPGLVGGFGVMRSDLLFNLGYVLLWAGLFAVARKGTSRWIVIGFLHLVTMLIALVTTSAYQYFKVTGSILDSSYLYLWLSSPQGTGGAIASELTPGIIVLLLAVAGYAVIGPLVVTCIVGRWRDWSGESVQMTRTSWLRVTGVALAAYAMFAFSLMPGGGSTGVSKALSRDAFVNIVTTAAEVAESDKRPTVAAEPTVENPPTQASLVPTEGSEKRNV